MKKTVKYSLIFLISLFSIGNFVYGNEEPGLRIENKCELKYPKEARETYNSPQYQLAYDRCFKAYTDYIAILNQISTGMTLAYSTKSLEEFEKVDKLMENLATIIEINGEGLIGWLNRDLLLQDIAYYRKKVQSEINIVKASRVPSIYANLMQIELGNTNTTGSGTSNSIPTLSNEKQVDECKAGFIKNKKTGKCRKLIQIKKKEVTK